MIDFVTWRAAIFGNGAPAGQLSPEIVRPSKVAFDPEADPADAVTLLTQAFTGAKALAADFSPAQIASGLWALLEGSYSSYGIALGDDRVPRDKRLAALAASEQLFSDLFAPVLGAGWVPRNDGSSNAPLAMACHSFWNVLPFGPERAAELDCGDVCLGVMRRTLSMSNIMCADSALIGLDLWSGTYGPRVREIIQDFGNAPSSPDAELTRRAQALLHNLSP